MKTQLFSTAVALALVGSVIYLPGLAEAQSDSAVPTVQVGAPQIDSFTVEPVDQLSAGTELVFTLQGTPNGQATMTIGNTVVNRAMQQIQPGVYQARYTIRSQDRFTNDTIVRANIQQGDRISSVRLQQPLTTSNTTANQPTTGRQSTESPQIQRFTAEPVNSLEPGTALDFTLVGTPAATATFSIQGVALNRPMREVSPGTYEGEYVIRRQDYFPTSGIDAIASLRANNELVRARLDQPLGATDTSSTVQANEPLLEIISPTNNSQVSDTVAVQGRSLPNTTVNVNVKAVNSLAGIIGFNRNVLNRTVTTDAKGNFSFDFSPTVKVPGTRYEVNLKTQAGDRTLEESLVLIQQ